MKKIYFKPVTRVANSMNAMPLCISHTDGTNYTKPDGTQGDLPGNQNGGDGGDTDGDGFVTSKMRGSFYSNEW